jgi:hypothetical protein
MADDDAMLRSRPVRKVSKTNDVRAEMDLLLRRDPRLFWLLCACACGRARVHHCGSKRHIHDQDRDLDEQENAGASRVFSVRACHLTH